MELKSHFFELFFRPHRSSRPLRKYFSTNLFLLFSTLFFTTASIAQPQQQKALEVKRAQLQEEIRQINILLSQQKTAEKDVLSEVTDLNQKIRIRQQLIKITNQQANLLTRKINTNLKKIDGLREELSILKDDYAVMIKKSYKNKSQQSRLLFLLSSHNFLQAYKRVQYMKQYTNYQKQQGEKIATKTLELQTLNKDLVVQRKDKEKLVIENRKEQKLLKKEKENQEALIASIRKKENQYLAQIRKKQREAAKIDREIEKLIKAAIAEANKKAGNTSNTSTFALTPEALVIANKFSSNKGKLIWPVTKGVKSRGYGQYSDPVYPGLKRVNNGVTIATEKGAKARAVFEGEVSGIIIVPGGNKAVQIRHGNFITTYYNLGKVYVKKGDTVKRKQQIGEIFTSPSTGKTELKFFLYKNVNRLNPEEWIYRM